MRCRRNDHRVGGRLACRIVGACALAAIIAVGLLACGKPSNRWVTVYGTLAHSASGAPLLRPAGQARAARQTFSALTVSTQSYTDVQLHVSVRTLRQLRTPMANPWEVGWVLWDFTDSRHFYYVALKPNGWEIGKEDPAYRGAQRFLATGPSPRFALGGWHAVTVSQHGAHLQVSAEGRLLASVTDRQRPYLAGRVGLYSEDAEALYSTLRINGH